MSQWIRLQHLLFVSFLLISILPVLSLAVWVQESAFDKETASVKEKHLLLARNLTAALTRYVTDAESTFRLASYDHVDKNLIPELIDVLELMELKYVCIIDAQGHVEDNMTYLPHLELLGRVSSKVMNSLKNEFSAARASPDEVIFSNVIHDGFGQPTVFLILAKSNNRFALGALSTDYIIQVAKEISFGEKGHAAIVDRSGHVLAHPNPRWRLQMKDISKVSVVAKMKANETGVATFYSPALKAEMIAGFTTVARTGWGVMVPQPLSELEFRAHQVESIMYYIVIVGFLFSSLVSWLLARYISIPIQNVVQVVEQVSQGNYTSRVKNTPYPNPKELSVLTASFNTMIDEMSDYENRLRFQATYDQLTKLPNRWLFLDRLALAITEAKRQKTLVGLLFIDLDRFKVVNDTYGHEFGDGLLKEVAQRLKNCARKADTVARIGGDEFTVIVPDLKETQMITVVANKVIEEISKAFVLEGREVFIGASLGITICPTDSDDPTIALQNGDIAMYQAKASGRNTYRFFTEEMNQQIQKRVEMEQRLHGAIEREEISLCYQPIIDVMTKKVTSVEVLMRWNNPVLGAVSPAIFIPLAEETGLIKELGEWMLTTACQQAKYWLDEEVLDFGLSVNLSSREIPLGFSLASIEQVLDNIGLPAHYLTFEITENLILDDTDEILNLLNGMKKLGVSLSIDDFGTGYSSFSYLTRFPIDVMKIDRAFTQNITSQPASSRLVEGMVALGQQLGLKIVAEGVETEEQFLMLKQYGCDFVQGFLFLKPVPAEELECFLAERKLNKS